MAKVILTDEILKAAIAAHCEATKKEFSEGEHAGLKAFVMMPGNTVAYQENGKLICPDQATYEALCMIIAMDDTEPTNPRQTEDRPRQGVNVPARTKPGVGSMVRPDSLTARDVIDYINPKATEAEAYLFAEFCRRKGADPMTKQVYLVIYEGQNGRQANFIAGKEYFTEKAEAHPQFDGYQAGIIIRNKEGELIRRDGTFWMAKEEELVGGWAVVYRKDRSRQNVIEVPFGDYNTNKNLWAKMPATMIRKVALVQALREAFPANFGGMYDYSEMAQAGIDPSKEVSGQ